MKMCYTQGYGSAFILCGSGFSFPKLQCDFKLCKKNTLWKICFHWLSSAQLGFCSNFLIDFFLFFKIKIINNFHDFLCFSLQIFPPGSGSTALVYREIYNNVFKQNMITRETVTLGQICTNTSSGSGGWRSCLTLKDILYRRQAFNYFQLPGPNFLLSELLSITRP